MSKHETLPTNPLIQIYINKTNNRLTFKIKEGNKLELQTPEIMKFFRSKKKKKLIDKAKNGENVPSLELVEVVLVRWNLVVNQHQQKSEVLYTFAPSKSNGYFLNVEQSNLMFLKTYNIEFDDITITFTDQNVIPVEIEDKVNLTLLVKK